MKQRTGKHRADPGFGLAVSCALSIRTARPMAAGARPTSSVLASCGLCAQDHRPPCSRATGRAHRTRLRWSCALCPRPVASHLGFDLPAWRPGHSGLEEAGSGSARPAQASTFSQTPVGSSHLPAELPCRLLAQPQEASGQRNNVPGGLS